MTKAVQVNGASGVVGSFNIQMVNQHGANVFSIVGDALFAISLEVGKNGGKHCISGSAGGQQTNLDFRTIYLKHIAMYGSVLDTQAEFEAIEVGKI
ncbi:hypothetical protein [Exiguobacterium sp. AM39-5BH]|uniref:hypothetical protein n=1 Tax=Exiguobacterium sp. AM39-5BH TaxID=2292355 RepID=UPI000FE225D5|nr:hypothetical protein [Exiguobacterium sp. AM39-5BH]RHB50581.1 hypothetical protein DW881_05400 [Exiguobacterium sp. AM39-5BH]